MRRFCDLAYRKELKLLGAYGGLADVQAEVCLSTCTALSICSMCPLPSHALHLEDSQLQCIAQSPDHIQGSHSTVRSLAVCSRADEPISTCHYEVNRMKYRGSIEVRPDLGIHRTGVFNLSPTERAKTALCAGGVLEEAWQQQQGEQRGLPHRVWERCRGHSLL